MDRLRNVYFFIRTIVVFTLSYMGLAVICGIIQAKDNKAVIDAFQFRSLIFFGVLYGSIVAIILKKRKNKS
jgi:hypothetical protein